MLTMSTFIIAFTSPLVGFPMNKSHSVLERSIQIWFYSTLYVLLQLPRLEYCHQARVWQVPVSCDYLWHPLATGDVPQDPRLPPCHHEFLHHDSGPALHTAHGKNTPKICFLCWYFCEQIKHLYCGLLSIAELVASTDESDLFYISAFQLPGINRVILIKCVISLILFDSVK